VTRPFRRTRAVYTLLRWLVLAAALLATTLVVSALVGAWTDSASLRVGAGLVVALVVPLVLRWRLRRVAAKGAAARAPRLGGTWFFVGWNALVLLAVCIGFSDATGRALRRRGDWFLGRSDSVMAVRVRDGVRRASGYLERFDVPQEARTVMADALRPQPVAPPVGPPDTPALPAVPAAAPAWFHPLGGPRRVMPKYAVCRFGARRGGRRPRECGLGHCGIDLGGAIGTPVHAIHDGVVLKSVRREVRGRGRHLVLAHKDGAVTSRYIHLNALASHLRPGVRVRGGEQIGTVGTTGLRKYAPHLHLEVAVKTAGGRGRYIDPEPLLLFWRLPEVGAPGGERPAAVARR
jgi:murein DD-endopeptidase MepM/ murein hydrolase activator NlpD